MRLRDSRRHLALAIFAALLLATSHAPVSGAASSAKAKPRSRPTAGRTGVECLGKAVGGLENIARFSSLYTRYEVRTGGLEGIEVHWRHASGASRESLDVPGARSQLIVFDGTRAWRRGADGAVAAVTGANLAEVVTDAYLGSYMHLVPGRIKGTVERVGLDRASGRVKLKVSPEGGVSAMLYLDTLTCLPSRVDLLAGGGKQTLHLRDWRVVGGIKLPHAIRRAGADTASDVRYTLVEARVDGPLRAGIFARPAPGAPPPVTGGETR